MSAGAITAVTAGYTDREEELLPDADPPTVEGNSGNEGYSSDVSTVVSLCGGAIFPDILDSTDAPRLFVAHDRGDPVVPFSAAESLYQQAIRIGVPAEAQFFYSPFHCSFANPQYDAIIGSQTPTLVSMMLFLADPLVQVAAARDIPDRGEVSMYPNPVDHTATFTFPAGTGGTMTIYDTMGRRVRTDILDRSGSMVFSRTGLSPGYYLCHFSWEDGRSATAPMILR